MLEDRATHNKNLLPGSDGKPDLLPIISVYEGVAFWIRYRVSKYIWDCSTQFKVTTLFPPFTLYSVTKARARS